MAPEPVVDQGTRPGETAGAAPPLPGRPGSETPVPDPAAQADRGGPDRPADGSARPPRAAPRGRRDRQEEASDRFLRALVTHRGTQVPSVAAMRAREVAVPTAQDIADAERDVVIKRRYYTPVDDLPTSRTRGRNAPRA